MNKNKKKNLKSQNIFKFLILQPESVLKSIKAEYFLNKCILKNAHKLQIQK